MIDKKDIKIEVRSLEELDGDPHNINQHTIRGHQLVGNSLRRRGAFRSLAAAGKNTERPMVYAGNLTREEAIDAGITDAILVHTNGSQVVVVVRDDIEPLSPEAVALGIEDNETAKRSYNPDIDLMASLAVGENALLSGLRQQDDTLNSLIREILPSEINPGGGAEGLEVDNQYGVIVMCESEAHQEEVFNALQESGYKVKVVVV